MSAPTLTEAPQLRPSPFLIVILAMLSGFAPMSIDMYLPSFPLLMAEFGESASRVQLTLSAFLLGFGLAPLFYGPIADRFGRRPVLMIAAVLYTFASVLCAVTDDVGHLIGLRFLQALGAGAGPVLARAVIRDLYERNEAARMMSVMMVVVGLAPMLAPILGGYVLVGFGWRAIFWLLGGFGLICLLVTLALLPETLPANARRSLAIGSTLRSYGTLLLHRSYLGYVVTSSMLFAGMFAYISASPFVFQIVFGVKPEHFGFLFGLNVLGMVVGAIFNSRLVRRHGAAKLLRYGTFLAGAAGAVMLLVGITGFGGLFGLMVPLFALMVAVSFVAPNATACALHGWPHMAGTASALAGTMQFGVGAVSGALAGLLYDGSALPMAAIIGGAGVVCFLAHRILVGDREPGDAPRH